MVEATVPCGDSPSLFLHESSVKGRYVVTRNQFKAGQIVLTDKPFAVSLTFVPGSENKPRQCFHCIRVLNEESIHTAIPCNGCPFLYCSAKCRLDNQKLHQCECSLLRALSEISQRCEMPFGLVLLLLRVILRRHLEIQEGGSDYEDAISLEKRGLVSKSKESEELQTEAPCSAENNESQGSDQVSSVDATDPEADVVEDASPKVLENGNGRSDGKKRKEKRRKNKNLSKADDALTVKKESKSGICKFPIESEEISLAVRLELNETGFPSVWKLCTHAERRIEEQEAKHRKFEELAEHVVKAIPGEVLHGMNVADVVRLLGILDVNVITVNQAWGLFALAAMLSHSCEPNCWPSFDPDQGFAFYAIDNIPPDTELTHPYCNCGGPTFIRQLELRDGWYFACMCQRCIDASEKGRFLRGVLHPSCPTAPNDSAHAPPQDSKPLVDAQAPHCPRVPQPYFVPQPLFAERSSDEFRNPPREMWKCDGCGEESGEDLTTLEAEARREVDDAVSPITLLPVDRRVLKLAIKNLSSLLAKHTRRLHPNHYLISEAQYQLARCLASGAAHGAKFNEQQLHTAVNLINQRIAAADAVLAPYDPSKIEFLLHKAHYLLTLLHAPTLPTSSRTLLLKDIQATYRRALVVSRISCGDANPRTKDILHRIANVNSPPSASIF